MDHSETDLGSEGRQDAAWRQATREVDGVAPLAVEVRRGRDVAHAVLDVVEPYRAGWIDPRRWRFRATVDLKAIPESHRGDGKRLLISLYRRGFAEPGDWKSNGVARGQIYLLAQDALDMVERAARATKPGDIDFALNDVEPKRLPPPASIDGDPTARRKRLEGAMAQSRAAVARVMTVESERPDGLDPLADPRDGVPTQIGRQAPRPVALDIAKPTLVERDPRPLTTQPIELASHPLFRADATDLDRDAAAAAAASTAEADRGGVNAIQDWFDRNPDVAGEGRSLAARARARRDASRRDDA